MQNANYSPEPRLCSFVSTQFETSLVREIQLFSCRTSRTVDFARAIFFLLLINSAESSVLSKFEDIVNTGIRFSKVPEAFQARKAIAKSRTLQLQSFIIHIFLI